MSAILKGKGMYLWVIRRVGTPQQIAEKAVQAGLSHVIIKFADGKYPYNSYRQVNGVDRYADPLGVDDVAPTVEALKARGIQAWGFQYVYGYDPGGEANYAVRRAKELKLDGFVINAEAEFKQPNMLNAAKSYCATLQLNLRGDMPIAFSSYRYPNLHRPLPFEVFLNISDLSMPQVYWVQSNNPEWQLAESAKQYNALSVKRPIFPTGAAYGESGWVATPDQVRRFLVACKEQGYDGANFWEWRDAFLRVPELGREIEQYDGWDEPVVVPNPEPPRPMPETPKGVRENPETMAHTRFVEWLRRTLKR